MKCLALLFTAVIAISPWSFSQEYLFKILVNKGLNQVKSSEQATWEPIKTGRTLGEGDLIKVVEDSYLGLVHISGRTRELLRPGTFEVEKISSEMGAMKKGIASKYTEFVFQRLADPETYDNLSSTGAVNRDVGKTIDIIMPPSSKVYDPEVIIPLSSGPEKGAVWVLVVSDMFSVALHEIETTTDHFSMNLKEEAFKNEKLVFFYAYERGNKAVRSADFGIELLATSDAEKVKQEVEQLLVEIEPQTALGQVILGVYFEQNDLLVDALGSYWRARELRPKIGEYQDLFRSFVVRNNLRK